MCTLGKAAWFALWRSKTKMTRTMVSLMPVTKVITLLDFLQSSATIKETHCPAVLLTLKIREPTAWSSLRPTTGDVGVEGALANPVIQIPSRKPSKM